VGVDHDAGDVFQEDEFVGLGGHATSWCRTSQSTVPSR
jgi:hypothetical protein